MSLSSNIDTKLEALIETPLPVCPQEVNLAEIPNSCEEQSCKVLLNAQVEQTKKLQGLCSLYYQHIQSLHNLIQ